MDDRTLHVTPTRYIKPVALGVLIFALMTLPCEGLLRLFVPGESLYDVTMVHPLLDTRYAPVITKLEDFATLDQSFNCLLVGSSLVEYLDPILIAQTLQEQTGQPIRCYNFALLDASASTVAQAVSLLAQDYKFDLVIWGVQAHSFYSEPESNENYFSESAWVRYRLGDFSAGGWLYDHSYLFRALKIYLPLLYFPDSLKQVDPPARTERDRHVIKAPEVNGYNAILTYRSSAPLFNPSEDGYVHYLTDLAEPSREDWQGIDTLKQVSADHGFRLVLVEFPTIAPGGASQAVMAKAANYARARDIPFLSTEAIRLPLSAYTDTVESTTHHYIHNHFHVSGSLMFSDWLGAQIGEAWISGAFEDVSAPVWTPPAQTLQPDYTATWGLSDAQVNAPLPANALVFNPSPVELDRVLLQSSLGLLMERQADLSPADWQADLDLLAVFDRMRYRSEIDPPVPAQWYDSADPALLRAAGIAYIMCREEPDPVPHCPAAVYDNPVYEPVEQWDYAPFYDRYILFQVIP